MRNRWWVAPVLAGGVVLLAACGSTASSSSGSSSTTSPAATPSTTQPASSSGAVIKTMSTSKGTVLATAQGKTIYWFGLDTKAKSNCNGSCATYWPPVLGKPSAAAGANLTMGFGTITRSDGKVQATYDGHPLYTYSGDTSAGQVNGNGLKLSGGVWWAMTPTGAKLGASASPSPSKTSGGGGY